MSAALHLITVWGDVQPELHGPFPNEEERIEAGKKWKLEEMDPGGVFWLDIDEKGVPTIGTYTAEQLTIYENHYRCDCGEEWSDEWTCMCNDRCPSCNAEIEPYDSDEIEP